MNKNNPRVYVLYGLIIYNTPKQFGGGEMAAAEWFYAAKEKFESFEATSNLHPSWGKIPMIKCWRIIKILTIYKSKGLGNK